MTELINMLLEPKIKTNIAILDVVHDSNSWTKTSVISTELNISERTVQHYFKDIFKLKEQYDQETPNNLNILYFKTKGIRIIDYTNDFEDFKKFTIQNSLTILLLQDIITNRMVSVANYSQKHYISETTVRKSLKRIKETFQFYGLDIRHFQLIGNEEKTRLFIALFYSMFSRENYYQVEGMDYNKLDNLFADFFKNNNLELSEMKKQKIKNMFLIHLQRVSLNKKVNFHEKICKTLKLHDVYSSLREVFNQYLIFDEREICYFLYVITLDEELNRNNATNIVYPYHQVNQSELFDINLLIFDDLKWLFRPLCKLDEATLKQDLFYINFTTIQYDKLFFEYKYNLNIHYNINNHPVITNIFSKVIRDRLIDNSYITEEQIDLVVQQYCYRLLYLIDSKNLDKIINIYIEPSFDAFQQQQLKEYLDLCFNSQVNYLKTYSADFTDMVLTPYFDTFQNTIYPSKMVTMVKFPLTMDFLKTIETKLSNPQQSLDYKYEIY